VHCADATLVTVQRISPVWGDCVTLLVSTTETGIGYGRITMTKLKKSYRISRSVRSLRYALLAAGLCCVGLFTSISLLAPQQVYARHASIPGGNVSDPTVRAVDIAKPAVVRIWTSINGHLTVHFPPTTDVSFPQQSNGSYPLALLGTGTFISSQGDILTADHVVHPPKDKALNQALYSRAAQDIANYMNQNAKAGSAQVSATDVVQELTSGQLQSNTTYDPPTSRAYLSTDYVGTFTATDLNSVPSNLMAPVDTIRAYSPSDQEDVAIVHVPMTDTPSVALGNSDNVQVQDQLTAIGFPGNADVSEKPQNFLASSVSLVYVSSKKTSDNGAPLIQISGNINHGNSGGPALDGQGAIVGVVSFGLTNGNSNSIEGTSFLQASSSALKLAQSINLDMTPGPFQKLWSQAFEDYAATTPGHWHKALQEFTQLTKSNPQFQAVQPFLTYAQTQAQTESDTSVSATPTQVQNARSGSSLPHSSGLASWQTWGLAIGAIAFLLVLAASLFTVSARKKKQKPLSKSKIASSPSAPAIMETKFSELPTIKSQSSISPGTGQNTLSLKIWPCGHMNRPNARFCSICGEAALDK
jgi:serine protease Do